MYDQSKQPSVLYIITKVGPTKGVYINVRLYPIYWLQFIISSSTQPESRPISKLQTYTLYTR